MPKCSEAKFRASETLLDPHLVSSLITALMHKRPYGSAHFGFTGCTVRQQDAPVQQNTSISQYQSKTVHDQMQQVKVVLT